MQVVAPVPPLPASDPVDVAIAIALIVGTAGAVIIVGMIARAWIRRFSRPKMAESNPAELSELRQQVGQLSAEVAELHERVDFTERMLATRDERARIERKAGG